jgi:hypothetical protein
MKNIFLILILFAALSSSAQVGIGTTSPNASSALELQATDKGLLVPRMTESDRLAINPDPAIPSTDQKDSTKGLLVYQTDNAEGFYYFDGTIWKALGGAAALDADWTIVGNNMYNANTGNVGVGITTPSTPSTQFHVKGTTDFGSPEIPTGPGPEITIFNEDFTSYSVVQNHTSDSDCSNSDGWESGTYSGTYSGNTVTSNVVGQYLYINSSADSNCAQDATAIVGSFSPTGTDIKVKFDYGYQSYASSGFFSVALFNETDGSVFSVLFIKNNTSFENVNFEETITGLDPAKSYSLRFRYKDAYGYGASVDNVIVTEEGTPPDPIPAVPASYVFSLEDGNN